ncbi:MAG TPA: DUF6484 domain-containing protein [Nitrosomonas sp.]|nr:DUF6484 domain-containing protein [Nitrosomonas sp.]
MSSQDMIEADAGLMVEEESGNDILRPLIAREVTHGSRAPAENMHTGIIVGELIGITNEGRTPLVCYPGQPDSAALHARSTIDLHGKHIGQQVVLMFEANDPTKPIIMGVLQGKEGWPIDHQPNQLEVDADGQRMMVSAKEQLVLRCGKASITLTKAGKVLIKGSYVLSRSSGVNRIKGGSVQLN